MNKTALTSTLIVIATVFCALLLPGNAAQSKATPAVAAKKAVAANPSNAPSSTVLDFQSFWNKFRDMTLRGDVSGIMTMTRFPLATKGQEDNDPLVKNARSSFPDIWKKVLSQDYATLPSDRAPLSIPEARHQTLREYIARTTLIMPHDIAGSNWARIGDLQFEKVGTKWQLTTIYTAPAKK